MNAALKRWLVASVLGLAGILVFANISSAQSPLLRRQAVITYNYSVPNYQAATSVTYYPYGSYIRTRAVSPYLPTPLTYSYFAPNAYGYSTIAYNNALYNLYYSASAYGYPYYTPYSVAYANAYGVVLP